MYPQSRPYIFFSLSILVTWLLLGASSTSVKANTTEDFFVYLPIVMKAEPPCNPNEQEVAIANLMRQDPNQQRPYLICNAILEQVARAKALDMGLREYTAHINPDGIGLNFLVQQAGYILPAYYDQSPTGNNIESIAWGWPTPGNPNDPWNWWMNSPSHRTHILGLLPFFAEQTDYGIGYAYVPNSPWGNYWVILTAKRGP